MGTNAWRSETEEQLGSQVPLGTFPTLLGSQVLPMARGFLGRAPGWPVVWNDYGSAVTTQQLVDEEMSIHAGRAPRAPEPKAPL